jgi:glycine cleavage system protein P-like pyridoxal-binding family
LREEHVLWVFERRLLKRTFGSTKDEITGGWRKLRDEELHDSCPLTNAIRIMKSRWIRCVRYVARMGQKMNACRILMGKPEGMRPLGSPRCKLECNIKIDLRGVACGGMDRIHPAQDRDQCCSLVNTVMILMAAQNVGIFLSSWATHLPGVS